MSNLEVIILGLIQGLTEFLPISSSGHLEIGKVLLGNNYQAYDSLLLTLVLHLGTALSTIFVFKKEIFEILSSLFKLKIDYNTLFVLKIIVSMIPTVTVGIAFQQKIKILFSNNLILVGIMFLITALILYVAGGVKNNTKMVSIKNAFILGIIQAIAILPGISRSGSTISMALILGIDREKAAKFSFLMVLPIIFGSTLKIFFDVKKTSLDIDYLSLCLGFFTAFISGVFACKWMVTLVRKSKLINFSYYCMFVGIISIFYGLF
ncbi:MAG: undecaprenyl-diphosphate phosphatase [Bacteroidota bacterium]|nr:undecaprenyl-diphosphate phosphatase [Bacteroidota bacterium]